MDFFEKLSKKATETYKTVADKTNKIASESNIKAKMNENKKKITTIYTEIGKKVYQKYTTDGNLDIKEHIQEELKRIDELNKEIEKGEDELLTLAGIKKCVKCNQNVPINSKFCPTCGAEQPEIVVEEKSAEQPEVVVEEKSAEQPEVVVEEKNVEQSEVVVEEKNVEQSEVKDETATEVEAIVDEVVEENKEENSENK